MGRKAKLPEEKTCYQLIAVAPEDYRRIKMKSVETKTPIKVIFKKLVEKL